MTALVVRGNARGLPLPSGKTCGRCGVTKPLDDFHKASDRRDGRRGQCIECFRAQQSSPTAVAARRAYRQTDRGREAKRQFRARNLEQIRAEDRRRRRDALARIDALKLERGCADCAYRAHPAALDFDHRDPSSKTADVSSIAGHAWAKVLAEIAKCDVVCANCHRIRTVTRRRQASSA